MPPCMICIPDPCKPNCRYEQNSYFVPHGLTYSTIRIFPTIDQTYTNCTLLKQSRVILIDLEARPSDTPSIKPNKMQRRYESLTSMHPPPQRGRASTKSTLDSRCGARCVSSR